jgi:hypothetical protein
MTLSVCEHFIKRTKKFLLTLKVVLITLDNITSEYDVTIKSCINFTQNSTEFKISFWYQGNIRHHRYRINGP